MEMSSIYSRYRVVLAVVVSTVFSACADLDRVFYENGGYFYPPPPPVQLDEPLPLPPPIYIPALPPVFSDEVPTIENPPASAYLPPINDVFPPHQLPPMIPNDDTVVIPSQPLYPPNQGLLPPQFRVENMSCTQGMNFRATFRMGNDSPQFPVVDEATEGCISPISGNRFRIELETFNSMLKCGVRRCKNGTAITNATGENMCVMVRIPVIRGVRLPEDAIVTLICFPQERVVSQTKHVKLGSNKFQQISKARSNAAGFVATGGTRKDLNTRIGIFKRRPGSNVFDQTVQADNPIQLGEELMLRAIVNEDDGWRNSQIGPVLITGLNSKKSILLINQQGCINPAMRNICPKPPVKLNPLTTELRFRAFLFQESPQGDEMVISVRTQGCLHSQDCVRIESCVDDSGARSRREVTNNYNETKTVENSIVEQITNWDSRLSFKVESVAKRTRIPQNTFVKYFIITGFLVLGVVLSAVVIILFVWQFYYRENK